MIELERVQMDDKQEFYSDLTGIDTGQVTLVRPEFAIEGDINYILERFATTPMPRVPVFGDIDFDLDLQQAYASVDGAKRAFTLLSEPDQEHFKDWRGLVNALQNGEYYRWKTAQTAAENAAGPPADTGNPA